MAAAKPETARTDPGDWTGRRADARENHERVLAAAIEVFTEHGIGATIPQVAARAGVGKATVYRSYPTKADLVQALARLHIDWFHRLAAAVEAARADAYRALEALLEQVAARLAEDRLMIEVLSGVEGLGDEHLEQQLERGSGTGACAGQSARGRHRDGYPGLGLRCGARPDRTRYPGPRRLAPLCPAHIGRATCRARLARTRAVTSRLQPGCYSTALKIRVVTAATTARATEITPQARPVRAQGRSESRDSRPGPVNAIADAATAKSRPIS